MLAVSLPLALARAQTNGTSADPQAGPRAGQRAPGGPPQAGPGGQFSGPPREGGQLGGPPQQGGQFGGPPQPGVMGPRMGMMGGGAIAVDDDFVYVLRGNSIFKVYKKDLKVAATGELPAPIPATDRRQTPGEPGGGGLE